MPTPTAVPDRGVLARRPLRRPGIVRLHATRLPDPRPRAAIRFVRCLPVSDWTKATVAVLLVVAIGSVVGIYAFLQNHDPFESALAVAVLTGLVAIALASVIGSIFAFRPNAHRDTLDAGGQLVALRPKCALTHADWLRVITVAVSEVYIAGHSLGKWCDEEHRARFTSELARILDAGKVTLVILHPDSQQLPRLQTATGTDYSERVRRSLEVLEAFVSRLPVEHRSRLKVSLLKDPLALPYMLVGNEHTLITATYLASRDSDEMPCLTLQRHSDAAVAIYNDFHALADLGEPFDP